MMSVETSYSSQTRTSGGMLLDIRSASPKDRAEVLKFLQSTDAPDLRFRFLSAVKPNDALATMLTNVDHHSTEDLIAFDCKDGTIAATAMIAPGTQPDRAEVAVLVRSDLKEHGIGWEMLTHACEFALSQGYRHVDCIEFSSNQRAISLEREQGFALRLHPFDAGLTILTKDLVQRPMA